MLHFQKATKSTHPNRGTKSSEKERRVALGVLRARSIEGSLATSMESISGGRVSSSTINNTPSTADQKVAVVDPISPDFRKAISSVLSRWNGLEMAVQNQWGGRDSTHKAQQLSADILSWFSQSKAGDHD